MVEIIIGVWTVCFCLSLMTVAYGWYLTCKKLNSKKLAILNGNLAKLELFWSDSASNFAQITDGAIEADARKSKRSALMIGFLGLASVPGFILLLLVVISVHFLVRSRKEIRTFQSPLATVEGLSAEEVLTLVNEIQASH